MNCELSVFNPEHDIVLASDAGAGFTPPKAARKLRADLAGLPSLWGAKDGEVSVWGWDAAVVAELVRKGVPREKMPSDEQLREIRKLSNRSLAVEALGKLRQIEGTTGESCVCNTYEDILAFAQKHKEIVLKAPWSSSGRGVKQFTEHSLQFINSTIAKQGSIIAEMKCDKVMDFALEYEADADGRIHYKGLSVFDTINGAYKGNLLASEEEKRQLIRKYVADDVMVRVSTIMKDFMSGKLKGIYAGPFGVDMMICFKPQASSLKSQTYCLNPCIEINLRRTMGHVALALTEKGYRGTMSVLYDKEKDKYELIINQEQIL